MSKTFKPILAPNEEANLDEIQYPIMASYKLDGIRCIFYKGKILSRSLKPIQNKQLKEKFEPLRKYSEEYDVILDGEIYSPKLTFQEITSFVMTQDFEDKKSVKKFGKVMEIPEHLKFYCFDYVDEGMLLDTWFSKRLDLAEKVEGLYPELIEFVNHEMMDDKLDVEIFFKDALDDNCEGLILRNPKARYKFGRGTLKEGIIYKVKPYRTFDAKIIGIVQSTVVDPNAEKKINELGRSVTSKKKDDRIPIEKASAFVVEYEGQEVKPVLAMTDQEKETIWKNRGEFIGKMIEYKGMLIGAKEVPRHPVFVRFRSDKD